MKRVFFSFFLIWMTLTCVAQSNPHLRLWIDGKLTGESDKVTCSTFEENYGAKFLTPNIEVENTSAQTMVVSLNFNILQIVDCQLLVCGGNECLEFNKSGNYHSYLLTIPAGGKEKLDFKISIANEAVFAFSALLKAKQLQSNSLQYSDSVVLSEGILASLQAGQAVGASISATKASANITSCSIYSIDGKLLHKNATEQQIKCLGRGIYICRQYARNKVVNTYKFSN